jgi:hypothetical protein
VARRKTSITEEGSNLGGILLEQGIVKFFVEHQSREEKHTSSKAAEEPESGFGRLHGEDEMQRNPIKMTLSEEPNRARAPEFSWTGLATLRRDRRCGSAGVGKP